MIPVIINGVARSGKDTFIAMCGQHTAVKNISSIDQLNDFARQIGWDGNKNDKYRKFISELKQLVVNFNDAPTNYLLSQIKLHQASDGVLFMHVREATEIAKIQRYSPLRVITLKIVRNVAVPQNSADLDASGGYRHYDYVIYNYTTLFDLANEAKLFVDQLMKNYKGELC